MAGRPANPTPDDATIASEAGTASVDPRLRVLVDKRPWRINEAGFLYFNGWDKCPGYVSEEDKEAMLADPQVSAALAIRRAAVLFEGVQVLPARKRGEDGYEKAKQIADAFRWMLGEVEGGLHWVLEQLLQCDWYKNAAGELVLVERTYNGKQFACLDIDPHLPCDYVPWRKNSRLLGLQPTGDSANIDGKPAVYPAEKFLWLPFRPDSKNWWGRDLASVTWIPYYMKNQGHPLNLMYMALFSNPSLVGTAPKGATEKVPKLTGLKDAFGRDIPAKDENGEIIMLAPQEAMMVGLENFQGSASTTVLPPEASLALLQAQGDGRIFVTYDDAQDWQIMVGILGTGNMTGRAKYGSNASAQTGESTVEKPANIEGIKLGDAIRQKVARKFVEWNYGPQHLDKVPRVYVGGDDYLENLFKAVMANSPYGNDDDFIEELALRTGSPVPNFEAVRESLANATPKPGQVEGTGQQQ